MIDKQIGIKKYAFISCIALLLLFLSLIKDSNYYINNIEFVSFLLIGIFSVFLLIIIKFLVDDKYASTFICLSYIILVLLLFIDRFIYCFDNTDPEMFYDTAVSMMDGGKNTYGGMYSNLLYVLFLFIGPQRIIAQFFNVCMVVISEIICFKIMRFLMLRDKTIRISTFLMSFSPHFLVISVMLRREAIIICLLTISLFFFIKYIRGLTYSVIGALFFAFIAVVFHSGIISIVLCYIVLIFIYNNKNGKFELTFSRFFVGIIVISLTFILLNYSNINFLSKFQNLESIDDVVDTSTNMRGGSAYNINITTGNSVLDIIFVSPIRIIYFVMSPLPWDWSGTSHIIAFIFSSLYYGFGFLYAIISLFRSNIDKETKNYIIILIFILLFSYFVFSWGVSNSGTALRHRDKFLPFFIILISLCIDKNSQRRKSIE